MKPTQNEKVLAALRLNPDGITPAYAWKYLGVARLAARVFELRHEHVIVAYPLKVGGATVSRYVLYEQKQLTIEEVVGYQ